MDLELYRVVGSCDAFPVTRGEVLHFSIECELLKRGCARLRSPIESVFNIGSV